MTGRFALAHILLGAFLGCAACGVSKSSNPLSPTVAGPIPGVNITQPRLMTPAQSARIAVDQQPITLAVQNSTSNGVRPLTYVFEVATDINFTNKVFVREGIQPGDNGQTTLRLPDALATGRTYFWRVHAQDGANTGSYSAVGSFDVFTPIIINAPTPVSPVNNTIVDSLHPRFTFSNAPRSGPVGAITYIVELSDTDSFANKIALWMVGEQPNQTNLDSPQDLPASKQIFWHVRAFDPTTAGPFSATAVFQTPAPVVVAPAPPPSGPIGPAPNDAINLGAAAVYNSPPDIARWPATATITRIDMSPSAGLNIEFTTKNSWPDVVPPGFGGPLQYTVWAVVNVGGVWDTSGFIQMWRGRESTGAPILQQFAINWAYDARWGPMNGYQPHAGEQMGFFVSAGNARGETGVSSVRERSNVVVVSLPAGDSGVFTLSLARARSLLRGR
jgi:hypothetical protein